MTAIRALLLTAALLVGTAGVYLGWALTSEEGYAAGG
ncbi:hypothetical protein DHODJN_22665 [Methylorubrum extorquens]